MGLEPQPAAAYVCDLSRWPIAVWRMQRVLSMDEVRVMLGELTAALARHEPYVQVLVASSLRGQSSLPPEARRLQSMWMKEHFAELSRYCLGMALVNDMSPMMHFAASLVMSLLGKAPSPWKMFQSEEAAVTWGERLLTRSSQTMPRSS